MFFRSERLFLRPIWSEDWQDLLTGIGDEAVVKNLAQAPWPYTAEDARAFAALPVDPRLPRCLITRPHVVDGAEVVGGIGLLDDGGDVALGYWVARAHWGQGYATEAARAMLTMARVIGHGRIVASHFLDNPASGRVLARLGFRATGEVTPRYCRARGGMALAVAHELLLREPGDCDDDSPGDAMSGAHRMSTQRAA
jgi:RimJ/RimL family protein N-acetyltransferase